MVLLSELIPAAEAELRRQYGDRLLPSHERALAAMKQCRNGLSPMLLGQCDACHRQALIPHSCGHRSCPHCQHHEGEQWLARQRAKLLPVSYFLVTFTLPAQLRPLAWDHQRLVYDLMLKLSWRTLRQFGLNDKKLAGQLGAVSVLHTHNRRLEYHPHVHVLVPAGAIDSRQRRWRKKTGRFLFREGNLAKVFRAKWLQALKSLGCKVRDTLPEQWVAHCKRVGSGDKALIYLGRYLYRGVIREADILRLDNGQVTYRYRDNAGRAHTRTLEAAQFLWLLLQHVLPKGLRRSRDFGFLHPNAKPLIRLLQYLFACPAPRQVLSRPVICCRHCGGTLSILMTRLEPQTAWLETSLPPPR